MKEYLKEMEEYLETIRNLPEEEYKKWRKKFIKEIDLPEELKRKIWKDYDELMKG